MKKLAPLAIAALATVSLAACGDDDEPDTLDAAITDPETVFDTVDETGDSYLDADEIAEWVDNEGTFDVWDLDADSELDSDEIAGNAFELWDADRDGRITEDEWETSTALWYPDDATPSVINDWDNDGDSELDEDEFTESFDRSPLGEHWLPDRLDQTTFAQASFELYDSDDDGKVTEAEWVEGSSTWGSPREP